MRIRILGAAAIVALLAGPAVAQQQAPMQRYGEKDKEKSQTELQADKDAERAYKRSLDAVPAKGPADPWGIARSPETPTREVKSATKTVPKAKAKTGEAAKLPQ